MDKFEQQFEDLDVQGKYVENSMNQTTALSTPQEEVCIDDISLGPTADVLQVDSLISQVADEYGLQLSEKIAPSPLGAPVSAKAQQKEEQDDLFARLNNLKAT
jgi:charged multivesicular body protein 1